ncbi:amidohydrolase family protein [Knoellia sp. Soil729]|uniref:amidohydrolase family protein n=1 Tax=Knoellia sp. Soil729 TaxID=1736394 RepID=UPI0006F9AF3F|nr:amidohydrolase family protein [Knoellia sp. Soil729]KRE42741.1 amidohydrolase [Knoellia sp. Soil729]
MTTAGLVERLGLPGIIDVHTHFMPEPVMRKVWAFFDRLGEGDGQAWPITYRGDEEERLEQLRGFGVRAFTSMLYPHKPGMAAWLNGWSADFAARTPDCLHTATFFPEESAGADVAAALDAGARVFKAHVQVGAYDPRDPLLDPVWGQLAESGTPVVIHCGSGPHPGEFTGPGPISEVLQRFPDLALVIAHMGAPEYAEFLDLVERHDNVHLDTTMAFTPFLERLAPFPQHDRARLDVNADRILFGSDFPNIPYAYKEAVDVLVDLGLGDDWLRAVLHDNAARLFSL